MANPNVHIYPVKNPNQNFHLPGRSVDYTRTFAEFTWLHPPRPSNPNSSSNPDGGGGRARSLSEKKENPLVRRPRRSQSWSSNSSTTTTRPVDGISPRPRYSKNSTFPKPSTADDDNRPPPPPPPPQLRSGRNLANFQVLRTKESVRREREDQHDNSSSSSFKKNVTPASSSSSLSLSPRDRIWENVMLFRSKCKELTTLQSHGKKLREFRIDLEAWKHLRNSGKIRPAAAAVIGEIPGVEIGDMFFYRVELVIAGIHSRHVNGIDYTNYNGVTPLAASLVSTDGYLDKTARGDGGEGGGEVIIYVGEGGGVFERRKNEKMGLVREEDQCLKRGNLALRNSMDAKNPVRVVRGIKRHVSCDRGGVRKTVFVYDGLYVVHGCERITRAPQGNKVYQFELRRIPGQRSINWNNFRRT